MQPASVGMETYEEAGSRGTRARSTRQVRGRQVRLIRGREHRVSVPVVAGDRKVGRVKRRTEERRIAAISAT